MSVQNNPTPPEHSEDSQQSTSGITFEALEDSYSTEESPQMSTMESSDGQDSLGDMSIQPTPGAVDFSHPLLKGRSPEEIQALVETLSERVDEQNRELNYLHSRVQASSQQSAPAPTSMSQMSEDEDYENSFLASDLKRLEAKVTQTLSQQIAPLIEENRQARAMSVREGLRQELRHFRTLEPHIDQLLRQQGENPQTANENQLRLLYHTALGLAAERGINLGPSNVGVYNQPTPPASQMQQTPMMQQQQQAAQNTPQQRVGTPMGIPQHRPSSAPMPTPHPQTQKPYMRELTETERKLANFYGMTPEQYLDEMYKNVDEVVTPGFSKEGW